MGNKNSWRFNFLEQNGSYTQSDEPTLVSGICVVRAPKGVTEPMFFCKGNESLIKAMIGAPTAHWPDIEEAIEFNRNHGIYIVAPAGSSKEYPSYYGGEYITKFGAIPMFENTNKETPNYLAYVKVGKEGEILGAKNEASISVNSYSDDESGKQAVLKVSGIDNEVMSNMADFDFEFWGGNVAAGKYRYHIDKSTNEIYPYINGAYEKDIVCGCIVKASNGTWTIFLGGITEDGTTLEGATNVVTSKDVPFLKVENPNEVEGADNAAPAAISYSGETIKFIVNIQGITYAYFVQKSPCENITNIKITDIGYDKYKYNKSLQYIWGGQLNLAEADGVAAAVNNNKVALDEVFAWVNPAEGASNAGLYKFVENVDADGKVTQKIENVTSEYNSQVILLREPLTLSEKAKGMPLYYVDGENLVQMDLEASDENLKPKADLRFNTVSISCSEDVGNEVIDGGAWTGSLDELGTNEFGNSIYFPDVLSDDDLTFIEFHVVKTFDDDCDEFGIYKYERIVDPIGPADDVYSTQLKGQRYMSKAVRDNIANGLLGGAWNSTLKSAIEEGISEICKPAYDDCHIAFECTGQEMFKSALAGIRTAHRFTTVVSEKIITDAEAKNCSSITVSGRKRGTAQLVGEFQEFDPVTRKKYWKCPIGDYCRMLGDIITEKLGGVAPAWLNENSLGGQLSRAVLKRKYDFDETNLKILDQKGLNPMIYNSDEGLMVVSSKTTELEAGDWSELGHSMAFDLCERDIMVNVMRPQLKKAIDDYYIARRTSDTNALLEKRTTGHRPIWDSAKCTCTGNKAARRFVIKVKVKVFPFSDGVDLVFTNVDQESSVED